MKRGRFWVFVLLVGQVPLLSGCTALLWNKDTFARWSHPADPPNLALFYSEERKDLLVKYDEARDSDKKIHHRCYWLEANVKAVSHGQKPKFVSTTNSVGLFPVPRVEARPDPLPVGLNGLYAVAPASNDWFTLYAVDRELESYVLPRYNLTSGTGKKVLLTPLAMAGDATLVGTVLGLMAAASDPEFDFPVPSHRKPKKRAEDGK